MMDENDRSHEDYRSLRHISRKEGSEEGDRPFFRSTLLPPDKALAKGSGIDTLAEEILGIVKR